MNKPFSKIITFGIAIGFCLLGFSSCKRTTFDPPPVVYGPAPDIDLSEIPQPEFESIPKDSTPVQTKE